MCRHPYLITCALLGVTALGLRGRATAAQPADQAPRPNILFVFADDWGWGDLACHGHPHIETPHLDRFAEAGTDFHQFNVASGVCSPSRAAVMTGHFPARHSIHQHFATVKHHVKTGMPDWLDPRVVLLPRQLQSAGYRTAHFGKWHLTNRDIVDAPLPSAYGYDEAAVFNGPGPQTTPRRLFDDAIGFITDHQKEHSDRPFFVNLWMHETHLPHYPAEEYLEHYAKLQEPQRTYAAVITEADHHFGRVMATLKRLKLESNTLVIFSSDNGPERTGKAKQKKDASTGPGRGGFYSVGLTGGLKGRKRSLFEGGVRVPFLVRWPGVVPAGKVDRSTVIAGVDLMPTFAALAGVKLPGGYEPDGEDLSDALKGSPSPRSKPLFWSWKGHSSGANWPRFAVRQGDWKLVVDPGKNRRELYEVPVDRSESEDLSAAHPDRVKALQILLADWRATLPSAAPSRCFSKLRKD